MGLPAVVRQLCPRTELRRPALLATRHALLGFGLFGQRHRSVDRTNGLVDGTRLLRTPPLPRHPTTPAAGSRAPTPRYRPYLNDVHGLDGIQRGNVLFVLNVALLAGVMAFTQVERWIGSRKWSIGGGAIASTVLLAVLGAVPQPRLTLAVAVLVLFVLASSYVMLSHAHARAVLPAHLVGRGLTLQNLVVFLGVFVMQALSGFIVGAFGTTAGAAPEAAYRAVFGGLALVTAIALAIYLRCEDPPLR
jgi:hypothetical protein